MKIDEAALQISYAVEGVKDNWAINRMLAKSIIDDSRQYRLARERAISRFPDLPALRDAVRVMDEFHLIPFPR